MRVVPPPHPASLDEQTLLAQSRIERGRSGGPGGQRRNKVETAVRIEHEPTGVSATATERREQATNLRVATFRLRVNLALQVRTERDLPAGPSALWRSRVVKPKEHGEAIPRARWGSPWGGWLRVGGSGGRIACNPRHADFPALLAEALDVLWLRRWDPKPAAAILGVSVSQLVRFIAREPAALALVNEARAERRQHPLRG